MLISTCIEWNIRREHVLIPSAVLFSIPVYSSLYLPTPTIFLYFRHISPVPTIPYTPPASAFTCFFTFSNTKNQTPLPTYPSFNNLQRWRCCVRVCPRTPSRCGGASRTSTKTLTSTLPGAFTTLAPSSTISVPEMCAVCSGRLSKRLPPTPMNPDTIASSQPAKSLG